MCCTYANFYRSVILIITIARHPRNQHAKSSTRWAKIHRYMVPSKNEIVIIPITNWLLGLSHLNEIIFHQ